MKATHCILYLPHSKVQGCPRVIMTIAKSLLHSSRVSECLRPGHASLEHRTTVNNHNIKRFWIKGPSGSVSSICLTGWETAPQTGLVYQNHESLRLGLLVTSGVLLNCWMIFSHGRAGRRHGCEGRLDSLSPTLKTVN